MVININKLKNISILEIQKEFFYNYKKHFISIFQNYYKESFNSELCPLDPQTIADNLYKALFYNRKDCYEKHFNPLFQMQKNGIDVGFFFAQINADITEQFLKYNANDEQTINYLIDIIEFLKTETKSIKDFLSNSDEEKHFEILTDFTKEDSNIAYLKNMSILGKNIKFFVHTPIGTSVSYARVEQIGNFSVTIQVSDEQMTALKLANSSFIIKNSPNEKNFSTKAKILCFEESTVVLEDIRELQTIPLLDRKYLRASIMNTSSVHLANENEAISGSLLDIGEGGIGIMSKQKSSFEKGQEIVAFLSYEDLQSNFSFYFEATGYVASIIGEKNAFRYGLSLNLNKEEKELIRHLIERR